MTYGRRKNVRRVAAAFLLLFIILTPIQNVLTSPVVSVAHANNDFCTGAGPNPTSDCLSGIIYLFAVYIPSNFAYATGYLFNFATQLALSSASYALNFLSIGWTIVRDIANLTFIFILIYIAYTIIMRAETSGTMRMLAWVVAMALLINFSFFITRFVVDSGNILAVQFYNAIDIQSSTLSPLSTTNNPVYVKDLTAGIMDAVKVQGILSDSSFNAFRADRQTNGGGGFFENLGILALIFVSVGIFLSLLGFIFLIVGIKFIVRVVVLWLTIIASPLAFAAKAVPNNKKVQGYYVMWQDNLIQSAFYPAVFLFIFLIMSFFLKSMAGDGGFIPSIFKAANDLANPSNGGQTQVAGVISIIGNITVRMGLVTVLLYFAMKSSDAFSSMGSGIADSVVKWTGGAVSGATSRVARGGIATTGFAGRNTIGRGANAFSRSALMQDKIATKWWGRPIKAVAEGAAKGSYDVRGVPGVKSTLESVGKIPGANKLGLNLKLGKTSTDSIRDQFKRRAESIEKRAKALEHDAVDTQNAMPESVEMLRSEQIKLQAQRSAVEAQRIAAEAEKKENDRLGKGAQDMGLAAIAETHAAKSATLAKELQEMKKTSDKLEKDAALNQKRLTDEAELRKYTDGRLKGLDKERKESLAKRLESEYFGNLYIGPSRGTIQGVSKIRGGSKSKTEEAVEHLKHAIHEDEGGHDKGHGDDDGHGGGGGHPPTPAPAPAHPPAGGGGGDAHPPAGGGGGDHGHDDHAHMTFKGIRAATQTYGSNQAAHEDISSQIEERVKRLDFRLRNVQENTKIQGTQMGNIQESLSTLGRTVRQQSSTPASPATFGTTPAGRGTVRPTTNTTIVQGVDEGMQRRMPTDRGAQGVQRTVDELANSALNQTPRTPTVPSVPQTPPPSTPINKTDIDKAA